MIDAKAPQTGTLPCYLAEMLPQIHALEAAMHDMPAEHKLAAVDMTSHHFAPGIYSREYRMQADDCAVSRMHKREHFIVMHGDVSIATEDGVRRFTGFHFMRTMPGTKRVVYAHGPTVLYTFHWNPTNTQDLAEIEAEHIVPAELEAIELQRFKELGK